MAEPQYITREWVFTAAKTDALLMTIAATEKLMLAFGQIQAANSNTGDVSVRLGVTDQATLPATSDTTGAEGILIRSGALPKGGGAMLARRVTCPMGYDLRFTCSNPVGGDITLILDYRILTEQDLVG